MKTYYYAPKTEVAKVVNDLDKAMKRIDKLWEKRGFGGGEMVFWSGNRDILHRMRDEIVAVYRKH